MNTDKMQTEILIYALARGESRPYMETLLSTQCRTQADIKKIKAVAAKDGWHSFRIARFTPGQLTRRTSVGRP